ncbi:hypothetical protein K8942_00225 [Candidatus Peribacteria bacterium]|nr:MAG: hypothetical protein K8942_00225 [Candidatus Peribacteria bacterium]
MKNLDRIVAGVCGLILLIVAVQSLFPRAYVPAPPPPPQEIGTCTGEPILVDFAFTGGVNEPWTCREQCDDNEPRYILYTNGRATQCETPPGCNDTGEDNNITCVPPVKSVE